MTPLAQGHRLPARSWAPSDPGEGRSLVGELVRYMPRLVAASLLVAAGEVVAGLALRETALAGSGLLTAGFAALLVVAGLQVDTSRERWIPPILAIGVYMLGVFGAALIPGVSTSSALLPILSVVLLLPGRGRAGIATILTVALAGSAAALAAGDLPHPFPPLREPLGSAFASATLLGVALLILGALTDFAAQARASLDGLRTALDAKDSAFAERTAIVASIGRLERRDTIEATAAVIVNELMRLPGIDLAGVLALRGNDLVALALTGPASFPLRTGATVPGARADHLIARGRVGPWSERWTPDPAFGPYGQAMTVSGVVGQAYAPWFDGGQLIGIVAIGSCSEAHVDHLVADLPAVAEFAATASLLLTPMLVVARERAATHDSVAAIIADRAFHPVFQPVVDLATGRTVGFEALTRFSDGRRPDLVFDEAAQTGLGLELEEATLETSVAAARDLPTGCWLSLNASPHLVVASSALTRILSRRDRSVIVEITEHVAIDDYQAMRTAIDRLGPGVRIAVDDAGAGIANFRHLVELWPRLVKVDAGLIRDLDQDLARQAAVVGFVHFAARAGCEVLAEGIETEAERRTAHDLGVTLGQGFLFARPALATTFTSEVTSMRPMLQLPRLTPAVGRVLTN